MACEGVGVVEGDVVVVCAMAIGRPAPIAITPAVQKVCSFLNILGLHKRETQQRANVVPDRPGPGHQGNADRDSMAWYQPRRSSSVTGPVSCPSDRAGCQCLRSCRPGPMAMASSMGAAAK